jgi:hypothetical protein
MSAGYPPNGPNGYPPNGQQGQQVPGAYAGSTGFAGPGGPGSVPGWQPSGGPARNGYPDYGYPAPDGYGQSVNGGEYAYVISDDGPRTRRPTGPQQPPVAEDRAPAAEPRRRTREERMQARPTGGTRSITAGGAGEADAARAANSPAPSVAPPAPSVTPPHPAAAPAASDDATGAYGLDDPGYGPPAPGWSHQDQPVADLLGPGQPTAAEPVGTAAPAQPDQIMAERVMAEQSVSEPVTPKQLKPEQATAQQATAQQATAEPAEPEPAATSRPAAEEKPHVRGPFEPLVEHDRQTPGAASALADQPTADAEGRPYEFPGLDDDAPAGSADAALDRLKELHRTAAAVAPQSLDAHFDQLLERQRRLISEYITEAERPSASTDAPGADDSLVGFGGDFLGSR